MPPKAAVVEAVRAGERVSQLDLAEGSSVVLGRSTGANWTIPGEPHLSRRHVELRLEGGRLAVRRLPEASNPVFHCGEDKKEFLLSSGEQFVIGSTRFVFLGNGQELVQSSPSLSQTLSEQEFYALGGSMDRLRLLDILELPEILRLKSEAEFFLHVAGMLRLSCGARWARIATEQGRVLGEDAEDDLIRRSAWDSLVVATALKETPRPTLFRWAAGGPAGMDWVVCAAAQVPGEPALVFYVAGRGSREPGAPSKECVRLVGLVADMVGRSLSVRRLQSWQGRLQHYFSGPVVSKILAADPKELEPRLAQSTVLFFDIRGFSKRTEDLNEKIMEYIGELRLAMTAMTDQVFQENGVVLQYMGDGLLACWNVPLPEEKHVDRAVRAALGMAEAIEKVTDGWHCGIGLHTGEVVAGITGSEQIFSYGVLGAVVNQASRVEGITKVLEAPILATQEVASKVSPSVAAALRLGRFQPAGMNTALDLYELSRPPGDARRAEVFREGLRLFEAGQWEPAYEAFDQLDSKDLPGRYLKSLAESYRRHSPKDWRGVIELQEK